MKSYQNYKGSFILAHRGGAREAPANSLDAFRHAYSSGCRFLETDVWLTTTGALVLSHDKPKSNQSYLTLSELLDALPGCYFAIDPKHAAVVTPLAKLIVIKDMVDRVCIGASFDSRAKRAADQIEELCGERPATALVSAFASGVLLVNSSKRLMRYRDSVQASFIHVHKSLVTPRTVRIAHKHNLRIIAWTINNPKTISNMLAWGVDGFMTDVPAAVLRKPVAS